jgi:Electron transfer DM13
MRPVSKRTWIIVGAVVAVPVLAVAWWLGSPLFLDTEVDEEFPVSADAVTTDDTTEEEVEQELAEAAAEPDTAASDDMPDEGEPSLITSGQFVDFDNSHRGTGTATIYELDDGSNVLRFENFEVTNGPDLRVYLVPNGNPESSGDITGYVELGALKGNIGDQNYEIPDDVDISEYGSVVIYCDPFSVIFSVATLS